MARVALLAHVKESTVIEPPPLARVGARIPWTGGKIVSNKDEALRKFYERKLRKGGDTLSPDQRQALEDSIDKLGDVAPSTHTVAQDAKRHKSKHDVVHKTQNATAKRMAHRAHVKVSSHSKKTIVVNGRVVGPKVNTTRGPKLTPKKQNASRRSPKSTTDDDSMALDDKLSMSLDALVKRNK